MAVKGYYFIKLIMKAGILLPDLAAAILIRSLSLGENQIGDSDFFRIPINIALFE